MHVSVLTDTVIAAQETAAHRFVKIDGSIGATVEPYGVTILGAESGEPMDALVLGIADVEVASGQTIAVGDKIASDADGRAIKDATTGVLIAKTAGTGGDVIEVLMK